MYVPFEKIKINLTTAIKTFDLLCLQGKLLWMKLAIHDHSNIHHQHHCITL